VTGPGRPVDVRGSHGGGDGRGDRNPPGRGGRAFDPIRVERLWRTVKDEDAYPRDYETPAARRGLGRYFASYDPRRRPGNLDRRTPASVCGRVAPWAGEKLPVWTARRDRIEPGDGRSVAARAAVAPAAARAAVAPAAARAAVAPVAARAAVGPTALRAPSAPAAGTLPMATVPPYSRLETVRRMGTS
jgi:hypothetical protein